MSKSNIPFALIPANKIAAKATALFKSATKLEDDLQVLLLSTCWHLAEHGNVNMLQSIVNRMPNGSRVERMASWITKHFPIKCAKPMGSTEYKVKLAKDWTDADKWDWTGAVATKWHAKGAGQSQPALTIAKFAAQVATLADPESERKRTETMTAFAAKLCGLPAFQKLVEDMMKVEMAELKLAREQADLSAAAAE